jgi:hypothetical protein
MQTRCQAGPMDTRADTSRVRGLRQVCVSADGPVTLRRSAGGGARRISGHGGRCPNDLYINKDEL